MAHPGGRPPKYKTAEELQAKIDKYFAGGMKKRTILIGPANNRQKIEINVPTITGLVLYCGFCDRASFYDLEKQDKFSHTIKNARTRIEREYEEILATTGNSGAIFALKNFGWSDKQEIKHSTDPHHPMRWIIEVVEAEKEGQS